MIGELKDNQLKFKRIFIETTLPRELMPLGGLAHNIWWSWNKEAIALFNDIHPGGLIAYQYNPLVMLDDLSVERMQALVGDKEFIKRLQAVDKQFQHYLQQKPAKNSPQIVYFSMEYGLHISLRLYSGGLGVLAGDYLKEASDDNSNLVAVGLLYRYGYFQQAISSKGDQINDFPPQEFTKLPISPVRDSKGDWMKIEIDLRGRLVYAKIWELKVGRVPLYLLDTDFDENNWEDRSLTHQLYGGDNEHRLRQEILLGIGGMKALKAVGIEGDIYHCNEGHAAFMGLERLKNYIKEDSLSYSEALEVVRATSLFTTHTPVPAGHDYFTEGLLRNYFTNYISQLGISWEQFIALGRIRPADSQEAFSMSHLAIRLSQEVNGVSKLHGAVSQKMFRVLYPCYSAEESHISYVTNSVHYPTWIADEWDSLYRETFGTGFLRDQANKDLWRKINKVSSARIMDIRRTLKKKMLDFVKKKIQVDFSQKGQTPRNIFEVVNRIDENALVIGFARRFATYKRAHLLFSNLERLAEIVNHESCPVIFLFSGKAHPADGGGQDLIRLIVNVSQRPEFLGKIIFLENYNMEIAKYLVQGVDVWLNTPTRPKEASGTSGMKAALNGIMNFSVLDGWWSEGYRPDAGWALPLERTYQDQHLQDELDAENMYNILETDLIPTYYDQDENGISERWVGYIRKTIAEVAPDFTMQRMLHDYYRRFYNKLAERGGKLKKSNFGLASKLATWKVKMIKNWDSITLVSSDIFDSDNHPLPIGEPFKAKLTLRMEEISPKDIGVEVAFFKRVSEDEVSLQLVEELKLLKENGKEAVYICSVDPRLAGVYEYGFRVFPKHDLLPHRQDLNLASWL